ncbi:MAG TPA: NAD(P)H-hydrate epimerase, partial [Spirochaetota bacterium]|nr:NAD(P)H-hydrate epimerase [Spirochaetota bacterium]
MKVVTAGEMQEIDRITIEERGMPAAVLMGMAGRAVADKAAAVLPCGGRVAILCGTGNNGGDGYVAGYYLAHEGFHVDLFAVGAEDKLSDTARVFHELCGRSGIAISSVGTGADLSGLDLDGYDCIIDALLGTGFSGAVRGITAQVIRVINDSDSYVLSIDVPSGLGSDGRAPEGEAVIADRTVAIGLPKISLVTYPGRNYAGELTVAEIGFPPSLTASDSLKTELIDGDFFCKNAINGIESEYAARADTHKGERGHLMLVGGFDGMEGAIMMAARAAFETGVGMASLLTTEAARRIIAGTIPELITTSLSPDLDTAAPDPVAIRAALADLFEKKRFGAVLVGPGMGRGPLSRAVCEALFSLTRDFGISRILIDGDGLFHFAGFLKKGKPDPSTHIIITPHFKEASILSGMSVE